MNSGYQERKLEPTAICLVCKLHCTTKVFSKCDFCTNAICKQCQDIMDFKIAEQTNVFKQDCEWCGGTSDLNKICYICNLRIDKMFIRLTKLEHKVLLKKYGTVDITKEIISKKTRCKHFSEEKCSCSKKAKEQVEMHYNVFGYSVDSYVHNRWLGICNKCNKNEN